ncbi:MAG: transglycosylase, partial [Nautilia sp.]
MKKLISLFFISFLFANEQSEFLNYKQNVFNDFYNYKKELNQEFNEYKEALNKGFKEYKKELSQYWKNPELTSKKVFVEYSKDKKVRKKVDYDKGYIEIDVIGKN